jgi:hypothetical protein
MLTGIPQAMAEDHPIPHWSWCGSMFVDLHVLQAPKLRQSAHMYHSTCLHSLGALHAALLSLYSVSYQAHHALHNDYVALLATPLPETAEYLLIRQTHGKLLPVLMTYTTGQGMQAAQRCLVARSVSHLLAVLPLECGNKSHTFLAVRSALLILCMSPAAACQSADLDLRKGYDLT